MKIQEYINQKENLRDYLLSFIDSQTDISYNYNYQSLLDFLESTKILKNRGELREFIHLISTLLKYHHRNNQNFFEKFEKIIKYLEKDIKQAFTNFERFLIFKNSKRFLLFLFHNDIITIDRNIVNFFIESRKNYCLYFYPEIKDFLDEKFRIKIEVEIADIKNFEEQRQTGENNSYLCTLIRNDSITEFISYVNKINLSLSSIIKVSFFEKKQIFTK